MKKLIFLCSCLMLIFNAVLEAKERKHSIYDGVIPPKENLENEHKTAPLFYIIENLNISFFDKMKDEDKDGVSDKKDKCPGTPAGVTVDKLGCPLDKDTDGIADYKDECPDIAGLSNTEGCPDVDKDGVADAKDRCPDVVGILDLKGCPDTDNDGVADMDDTCPNTTGGYKVNTSGCPFDNDNDGVANEDDLCPDAAGPPALKGCSDTDGDGVADNLDRCPTQKGNISDKGCPKIASSDIKKITDIAGKIYFENNSSKLKESSLPQLDYLVTILNRYDATNLQIEGHADSNSSDKHNITLSKDRAEAVKTYLMTKGIADTRLITLGFGDGKPIASNETNTGRATNRRVELKTLY